MKIKKHLIVIASITTLLACNTKVKKGNNAILTQEEPTPEVVTLSKAELILNEAIEAHGGDLYNTAYYQFEFRGDTYKFKNNGQNFEYTKISRKDDALTEDVLKNDLFSRKEDGHFLALTQKKINSAKGALNSVIYFATLPYKLNDASVNKTFIENTTIKGEPYAVIGVTFNEEGGGEDFDDAYHYWINTTTHKIDYLAYNYSVNEGGVRFRSAYNKRVVNGITFQDYINYEAEVGTPLKDLPKLYEAGELKELSKIETENVVNLNK